MRGLFPPQGGKTPHKNSSQKGTVRLQEKTLSDCRERPPTKIVPFWELFLWGVFPHPREERPPTKIVPRKAQSDCRERTLSDCRERPFTKIVPFWELVLWGVFPHPRGGKTHHKSNSQKGTVRLQGKTLSDCRSLPADQGQRWHRMSVEEKER